MWYVLAVLANKHPLQWTINANLGVLVSDFDSIKPLQIFRTLRFCMLVARSSIYSSDVDLGRMQNTGGSVTLEFMKGLRKDLGEMRNPVVTHKELWSLEYETHFKYPAEAGLVLCLEDDPLPLTGELCYSLILLRH